MNKTTNSMTSLIYACKSALLPVSLTPPEVSHLFYSFIVK